MARVPNPPRAGQPILPWAHEVTAFLRSAFPRGLGVRSGPSGTTFRTPRIEQTTPMLQRPPDYRPFQLVPWYSEGETPEPRLRVVFSTVGGNPPTGFNYSDTPPFLLAPQAGTWIVLIKVTISSDTGTVTAAEIIQAASRPDDTSTVYYVPLGGYNFDPELGFTAPPVNAGFGPVDVKVCYEDFTEPPEYNVEITLK